MFKTLEDILIETGVANTQQVSECKKEIEKSGALIEKCLLEKKFITPEQLTKAYADYSGYEVVPSISEKMADLNLLAKIPLQFLRSNVVIPIMKDDQVMILTANPFNFQPLDELAMLLGGDVKYGISQAETITEAINRYYPLEGGKQMIEDLEEEEKNISEAVALEDIQEKDILTMASEAPIIKLVNHILYQAVKRNASDIHVEPFEKEVRIRYRIDGIMQTVMTLPKRILGALVSRLKIMAHLDIAEKRVPQDGRINIRVADKPVDIRVSVLPVAYGERIVMRILIK
jgi:general secretion pathway protein E